MLHDTQYQIFVPREEARTFKSNFEKVKGKTKDFKALSTYEMYNSSANNLDVSDSANT